MPRGLLTRLVISFALAIVCFCGSTLYATSIARDIDEAALSIATNAVPSIGHLTEARTELRQLDLAVQHYAVTRSAADREEVAVARSRLDTAIERYLADPSYADERALWGDMLKSLSQVYQSIDAAILDVRRGRPIGNGVMDAINHASEAIRQAIDFNAVHARELALRIQQGHLRSTRVALGLDLLSTLFTVLAGFLAIRALQHYSRVLDERNQLAARRAEELEQFAGRVAHDILGPLSATRLAVSLVATQVSDPSQRRSLDRGKRGVDRVASIVDGLLRFARAGARPEPGAVTPVAPVVQGVVAELEPVAAEAGVTLTLAPLPDCAIYGHAGVLASIVENLVRNAIKYMNERPERRVDVNVAAQGQQVRLVVRDSGPGISASLADTIFDPHVRGQSAGQPGIGLGLATVKRITEAHGGKVGFESRLGEGSTFWVELPRADYEDDNREKRARAQAGK